MKFKIDENLPVEVAELFQQAGYDVLTIYDQNLVGKADLDIASICQVEKRAIVTLDVGFADIREYPPKQFAGIVVMRLNRQDKSYVLQVVGRLIKALSGEELNRRLWIVDERRIRVRE